jgi:hypothetical protein
MRHVLILVALFLTGCATAKFGYRFDTREFWLSLERPLEPGLKK